MPDCLPDVAVLPSKRIHGLASLAESPDHVALERVPMLECFERSWSTDAHFVTYTVRGPEGQEYPHPRLNKSVLADIRDQGCDVCCSMLVLDYDNPSHAGWDDFMLMHFVDQLEAARAEKPHLFSPTAIYTTRHGARLVYVLEAPVPADEAELRLASLVRQVRAHGILVDEATKDWTRLFRLPKVVRDDVNTEDEHYFVLHVEPDNRLQLQHVPAAGKVDEVAPVVRLKATCPGPEEAEALLWTSENGNRKRTEWYKLARRCLRGRDCFGCIFEGDPVAEKGKRNPTVIQYAGSVVSLMFSRPGTTAEKCFALLAPAVMQLEGDDGGRLWLDTLWHGIKLAWEREAGKAKQQEHEARRARRAAQTTQERILEGVRRWAEPFDLPFVQDDDKLWEWIEQRMIVAREGKYMVMNRQGFYNSSQVRRDALPAHIRRIGMDDQMNFWSWTKTGEDEWVRTERSLSKVLSDHLSVIDRFVARPNVTHAYLEPDETGACTAVLPMYHLRTDVTACFDPDVDEWLRALGGEQYDKLCAWIGHALDFSRPIAALSVLGTPSCGKQLLVRGLAECINTRMLADGSEMVSDYQFAVRWTPFLNVNEGWPRSKSQDPADMFRRWTGGDAFYVNAKFEVPVYVFNPLRIILTANNDNLVKGLTRTRNLTLEDRDAIAVRLFHLNASDGTAARYLREKGGMEFTRGWVDGADGERGDDRVARHFLYLHQLRDPVPTGNRLLVEGGGADEVMLDMAAESGIAPDVIETVLHILENPQARTHTKGFSVNERDGVVYTTATPIMDYWHKVIAPKRMSRSTGFHHRAVARTLRTLTVEGWDCDAAQRVPDGPTGVPRRARWYLLDNWQLLRAAEQNGFECDYLIKLMKAQQGTNR